MQAQNYTPTLTANYNLTQRSADIRKRLDYLQKGSELTATKIISSAQKVAEPSVSGNTTEEEAQKSRYENKMNFVAESSNQTATEEKSIWDRLHEESKDVTARLIATPTNDKTNAEKAWTNFARAVRNAETGEELLVTQGQALSEFRQKSSQLADSLWEMYGSAGSTASVDTMYGYILDSALASLFQKDTDDITRNREMYKTLVMGRNVDNVSTLEAMGRAWQSDSTQSKLGLYSLLYHISGQSEYWQDKIDEMQEKLLKENTDFAERSKPATWIINSMPILRQGMKDFATTALFGALGSVLGSISSGAGISLKTAFQMAVQNTSLKEIGKTLGKNVGVKVGYGVSALGTFTRESGSLMLDLSELRDANGEGLSEEDVIKYGIIGGVFNTIVEYATPDPFSSRIRGFDFASIMGRSVKTAILNTVTNSLASGISESTEEFIQSLVGDVVTYVAKRNANATGMSFDTAEDTADNFIKNATKAFAEAFMPSVIVGFAGTGRQYLSTFLTKAVTDEDFKKNLKTSALRTLDSVTTSQESNFTARKEAVKNQQTTNRNKVVDVTRIDIDTTKLSKAEKTEIKEKYADENGKMPVVEVVWDSKDKIYKPATEKDAQVARYLYQEKRAKGFAIKVKDTENLRYSTKTVSSLSDLYNGDLDVTTGTITFDNSDDMNLFLSEEFSSQNIVENSDGSITLTLKDDSDTDTVYTIKIGNVAESKKNKETVKTTTVSDNEGNSYEIFTTGGLSEMLSSSVPSMSSAEREALVQYLKTLPSNVQNDIIQKLKDDNGDIRDFIVSADSVAMSEKYKDNQEMQEALKKGRALSIIESAQIVLKDGKTRGKDVVHEVFHVLWNIYPEYRNNLVSVLKQTLSDSAELNQLKQFYEENKSDIDTLGNKFGEEVVGTVDSWKTFLQMAETASDMNNVEQQAQSGNTAIEELYARISTVILQDPSDTAIETLPTKLKNVFKKVIEKLKSVYSNLVGKSAHAPQSLEEAVLSVFRDGNLSNLDENGSIRYAEEISEVEKAQEELKKKYDGQFIESKNKGVASEEEERAIKEIVYSYPKHQVTKGVQMLDGLQNDNHDMPMQKEYLTARLVNELFGEELILLPRYMDRMLNPIAGYLRFNNYSLSDGVSAVSEEGKTFEFKYISSADKAVRYLNKAIRKADVGIVIVSSPTSIDRIDVSRVISGGDAYIINIYDENNVEVRQRNTSTEEWRLGHQEPEPQHILDNSSNVSIVASELQKVNPEDQTTMDYSVYSNESIQPSKEKVEKRILQLQINMESNPSVDIDLLKGYHKSSTTIAMQSEFAERIRQAISDENGLDIIDKYVGLTPRTFNNSTANYGIGIYGGNGDLQISVGQQNYIQVTVDKNGNISTRDKGKLNTSALLHAIFLRQDAVTWGHIKSIDIEGGEHNAFNVSIGRNLTEGEAKELCAVLNNKDYGIVSTPTGAWVANFSNNSNEVFHSEVISALDGLSKKWQDDIEVSPVNYEGNYISVNWEQGENGYAYPTFNNRRENKTALYEQCYNEFADKLQGVYEEFSKKFDWGNANKIPTVEDVTKNSIRYSEELEDINKEIEEVERQQNESDDYFYTQFIERKNKDYGNIFNPDNPNSILNRNIKSWDDLTTSDIDQFIKANVYVPEKVLNGEKIPASAVQELEDRETINRMLSLNPELRDIAESAKDEREFLQKAKQSLGIKGDGKQVELLNKYYNYSQTLSPKEFLVHFYLTYGYDTTTLEDLQRLKSLMSSRKVAKVTEDGKKITTVIANDTSLAKLLTRVNKGMTEAQVRNMAKQLRQGAPKYVRDLARTLVNLESETAKNYSTDFDPQMTSWLAIAMGTEQDDLFQANLRNNTVSTEMEQATSDSSKSAENTRDISKMLERYEDRVTELVSEFEGKEIKRPTVEQLMRTINKLENTIESQQMSHNSWKNAYYQAIDQIRLLDKDKSTLFRKLSKLVKLNSNISDSYQAKAIRLQKLLAYTNVAGNLSEVVGSAIDLQKALWQEVVYRNNARNSLRNMLSYNTGSYDAYYIDPTMRYLYKFIHNSDKIIEDTTVNEYSVNATKRGERIDADDVTLVTYDYVNLTSDNMEDTTVLYDPNSRNVDLYNMPAELERALPIDIAEGIKDGTLNFKTMTSADLNKVRSALSLVKQLSKMSQKTKEDNKKMRRRERAVSVFSSQFGFDVSSLSTDERNAIIESMNADPNFGKNVLEITDADIEDYIRKNPQTLFSDMADKTGETLFGKKGDIFATQFMKMQRIAERMDGQKNGPIYENFFRPLFEAYEKKKGWVYKRQQSVGEAIATILGNGDPKNKRAITQNKKMLNETKMFKNATLNDGRANIELTGWEQMGVYIYSQNIFGFIKLISSRGGNNIALEEVARINPKDTLKFIDIALMQREQNQEVANGQTNKWWWSKTGKAEGTDYYAKDILNHVSEETLLDVKAKLQSGEISSESVLPEMIRNLGDTLIDHVSEREDELIRAGYDEYNMLTILQERYFPLVALDDNMLQLKAEQDRKSKRVSKGMLLRRQLTDTYALKLNPLTTLYTAIQNQESMINMSQTINDMHWLMSSKGGNLKGIISQKFGTAWGNYFEEYLNMMAGAGDMNLEEMDKVMNKFIGNIAVSRIALNPLVSVKQLISLVPAMTLGDLNAIEVLQGFGKLTGNKKDAWKMLIEQNSPTTFYSAYNVEAEKAQRYDDTVGSNGVLTDLREKTMWLTEKLDGLTKGAIWIAKYEKEIQNGASVKDASFRATQLVQTSQSITDDPSLAKMQRNKNPLWKIAFMFSNDAFQTWNIICGDMKNNWDQGMKAKTYKQLCGILLSNAILAFLAGGWLPDEEDEDDNTQLMDFLKDWGYETLGNIPLVGSAFQSAYQGYDTSFYQGLEQGANLMGMIGRQVEYWRTNGKSGTDYEAGDYIDRAYKLVMEGVVSPLGGPTTEAERLYKALFPDGSAEGLTKNANSMWYLLGSKYGKSLYTGN